MTHVVVSKTRLWRGRQDFNACVQVNRVTRVVVSEMASAGVCKMASLGVSKVTSVGVSKVASIGVSKVASVGVSLRRGSANWPLQESASQACIAACFTG